MGTAKRCLQEGISGLGKTKALELNPTQILPSCVPPGASLSLSPLIHKPQIFSQPTVVSADMHFRPIFSFQPHSNPVE